MGSLRICWLSVEWLQWFEKRQSTFGHQPSAISHRPSAIRHRNYLAKSEHPLYVYMHITGTHAHTHTQTERHHARYTVFHWSIFLSARPFNIVGPNELIKAFIQRSWYLHIDGLVQERRNSIANALELRLSCTNPSIYNYNPKGDCFHSKGVYSPLNIVTLVTFNTSSDERAIVLITRTPLTAWINYNPSMDKYTQLHPL